MARRSTLERGSPSAPHDSQPPVGAPDGIAVTRGGGSGGWRGGGGRWWIWAGRAVVWAALIVIAVNGVRAIFVRETQTPGPAPASHPNPSNGFPATLAEAFALQFGQVYLNFDQNLADERARHLAAFVPGGASQQFGWNGVGRMQLQSEQVAGIDVRDEHDALVQLLVTVNGAPMEFSVPIYAAQGGMVVSGQPALLPPPARVNPPGGQSSASQDLATQNSFESFLPSFFQAYATSDAATLGRYITKGFSVGGLGGVVTFDSIQNLFVPQGGSTRDVTATVRWRLAAQGGAALPTLDVTYDMTWTNQGGTWSLESIKGSTQQGGQQ